MRVLVPGLLAAVKAAEARLLGRLVPTELRRSASLSDRFGYDVYLKLECTQITGSFKFRPALNSVLAAEEEQVDSGLGFVTSSSGNFGIAAARACELQGKKLKLVMMPSASNYKAEIAKSHGAEIVCCRDDYAAREELVRELCEGENLRPLHPHDSLATVAGDASVALEIDAQLKQEMGSVLVPTSGAGLLAGIAAGFELTGRHADLFAVQPKANGSLSLSLAAGERVRKDKVMTMADGLTAAIPGVIGFEVAQNCLTGMALLEEDTIPAAMRLLWESDRVIVEPASSLPLAALMTGAIVPRAPVVLILTGSNIAKDRWKELTAL